MSTFADVRYSCPIMLWSIVPWSTDPVPSPGM
jgi:hypothetical protein